MLLLVVGCGLAVTSADGAEVDGVELSVAATLVGVDGDGTASAGKVTSGDGVATDDDDDDDDGAAADDTSADCCDCC